jgi:hypothetical protein
VKLESENIAVNIKDELTAQVNNFYSNAIGGVKLQVKHSDFEDAYRILLEFGYIKEQENKPNKFLLRFEKLTSSLPIIGKLRIELRLLISAALILILIIAPIVLITSPTTYEKLIDNSWCVDRIVYNGQELTPNSTGLKMTSEFENCSETMLFRDNGIVDFPGINSSGDRCKWELRKDSLIITEWYISKNYELNELNDLDEFVGNEENVEISIFHGAYKLEIKDNMIKMQSDILTIYGRVYRFNFRF